MQPSEKERHDAKVEMFTNLKKAWVLALIDKFAGTKSPMNGIVAVAALHRAREMAERNIDLSLDLGFFDLWLTALLNSFNNIKNDILIVPELKLGNDTITIEERINTKEAFELALKLGEFGLMLQAESKDKAEPKPGHKSDDYSSLYS